jgi:hypothetical protein
MNAATPEVTVAPEGSLTVTSISGGALRTETYPSRYGMLMAALRHIDIKAIKRGAGLEAEDAIRAADVYATHIEIMKSAIKEAHEVIVELDAAREAELILGNVFLDTTVLPPAEPDPLDDLVCGDPTCATCNPHLQDLEALLEASIAQVKAQRRA